MSISNSAPVKHRCRAKSPASCPFNDSSNSQIQELTVLQYKALAAEDYDQYVSIQEQISDLRAGRALRSTELERALDRKYAAERNFTSYGVTVAHQELLVEDLEYRSSPAELNIGRMMLRYFKRQRDEAQEQVAAANVSIENIANHDEEAQKSDVMLDAYHEYDSGFATDFLSGKRSGRMFSPKEYNSYVDSTMGNPNLSDDERGRMISVMRRQMKQIASDNYKQEYSRTVNPSTLFNKIAGMFEQTNRFEPDLSTPEKRDVYIKEQMGKMKRASGSLTSLFKNLQAAPMGAKLLYRS